MLTQELDWETSQDFWWHGDIGSVFGVLMLQSLVATVSYLGYFFPILNSSSLVAVITGQLILWIVIYVSTPVE